MAHTPLPWPEPEYDNHDNSSGGCWYDIGPARVAYSYRSSDQEATQARDDADLVWRAVNCHDELVAALEELYQPRAKGWKVTDWDLRMDQARAALAHAKGGS